VKLTESILRQGGEELTSKLGTEEIIIPFKELVKYDFPISTLYYLHTFCEMSRQDILDYYDYMEITNSQHIYDSRLVFNCNYVRNSEKVSQSRQVLSSSNVFNSTDIIGSDSIDWSTHIYKSREVKNCELVYESEKIEYSSRIVLSLNIEWCKDLIACEHMSESAFDFHCAHSNNVYFSSFVEDSKNCWFCLNIEKGENQIFNETASPKEIAALKNLYTNYITDDWSNIIKPRTATELYTVNPTFKKLQLPPSFIHEIKELPQFKEDIWATICLGV